MPSQNAYVYTRGCTRTYPQQARNRCVVAHPHEWHKLALKGAPLRVDHSLKAIHRVVPRAGNDVRHHALHVDTLLHVARVGTGAQDHRDLRLWVAVSAKQNDKNKTVKQVVCGYAAPRSTYRWPVPKIIAICVCGCCCICRRGGKVISAEWMVKLNPCLGKQTSTIWED